MVPGGGVVGTPSWRPAWSDGTRERVQVTGKRLKIQTISKLNCNSLQVRAFMAKLQTGFNLQIRKAKRNKDATAAAMLSSWARAALAATSPVVDIPVHNK